MRRLNSKSLLLPFALAAFPCVTACGSGGSVDVGAPSAASDAIINGESCDADTYPTAAAILVDARVSIPILGESDIKTVICTGTLIAPDTVLTAAHCLDATGLTFGLGEVLRESYSVTFDADLVALAAQGQEQGASVELPESRIEAASYFIHEDFQLDNFEGVNGPGDFYDIGVIFLEETVSIAPEIVITTEEASQLVEGAEVAIAGWGQQVPTNGPFDPPPEGSVGQKVCAVSFINEVGATEFQVGGDSSTSRKCHGDSGGPTYMTIETDLTNKQRVIGITSHAYDAEDCAKGGVDTRIDSYMEWLDDKMVTSCEDGTRAWCDVTGVVPPSYYEPETNAPEGTPEGSPEGEPDDDNTPPTANLIGGCNAADAGTNATPLLGALFAFGLVGLLRRRKR